MASIPGVLAAVALISMVVVAGCTREVIKEVEVVVTATPTATSAPADPGPKVFRIGLPADITTTNVWSFLGPDPSAYNLYVSLNRYPTLYALADQRLDWVPAFADGFPTAFEQEGDLWTSTIAIKDGATWSDGTPVSADDFVFTWEVARDFELPGTWQTFFPSGLISNIEAVDAKTVKVSLTSEPGLAQWQYGITTAAFVAKHYWDSHVEAARGAGAAEEQRTALFAVVPDGEPSAGEMVFGQREAGAFVQVSKNDNYFFAGSEVTQYANGGFTDVKAGVYSEEVGDASGDVALSLTRGPHVDRVIFSVYESQAAAVLAMQNGDIDYMASPLGLQPGFKAQLQDAGTRIISNVPNSVRFLSFNTQRAPMDNKAFRQAVAVLIDKEFLSENVLQGTASPAYSMVPPGNGAWHNPDVPELGKGLSREDRVAEAIRILKAAGFSWDTEPTWDADNLAVKTGSTLKMPNGDPVPELELMAPSAGYDPMRSTFGVWTERWLNEVGIPTKANLTGFNVILTEVFDAQNFDMYILGWGLEVFPGYLGLFFHTDRSGIGDYNSGGYSNAEFDELADALNAESDLAAAKEQAFRLQEILADELPYIVLFTTEVLEPVAPNVEFAYESVIDGVQNYLEYVNGPLSHVNLQ